MGRKQSCFLHKMVAEVECRIFAQISAVSTTKYLLSTAQALSLYLSASLIDFAGVATFQFGKIADAIIW